MVPGLLQTEEYARAVLSSGPPLVASKIDEYVAARMEPQRILARPKPPLLWVVLDEAVLRRTIGGANVMRAQLAHLVEAAISSYVVLQVLPFSSGPQAGLSGAFTILVFDDGPPAVWTDGPASGQLVHGSDEVSDCLTRYDREGPHRRHPPPLVPLLKAQRTAQRKARLAVGDAATSPAGSPRTPPNASGAPCGRT